MRVFRLSQQLSDSIISAAICAQEIRKVTVAANGGRNGNGRGGVAGLSPTKGGPRPIVDASTMSVLWHGRSVHLGTTLSFRVLERLAQRPDQYISYGDLLHDAWNIHCLGGRGATSSHASSPTPQHACFERRTRFRARYPGSCLTRPPHAAYRDFASKKRLRRIGKWACRSWRTKSWLASCCWQC
jgi:hypothetical protein